MHQCRWRAVVLAILLVLGLAPLQAASQERVLEITSDAIELDVGGRVQTQLRTTSVEGEEEAELFLRRTRLEIALGLSERVSGRLQTDFAGDKVAIKDAYFRFSVSPALEVLAGKAYRPFSLLEQTSSTRILPIERGLAIRGVGGVDQYELIHDLAYSDRDVGLQVVGAPAAAPLGFAYAVGLFAGPELPGRPASATPFQYVARISIAPVAAVRVGGAWSSRAFVPDELTSPDRGNAFELDVEVGGFDPGFHFLGELVTGELDPFTGADFSGAQGWLGWRTGALGPAVSGVEPLFRASYGDVDEGTGGAGASGGSLLTPGVNVYLGGLNRLMLNYDMWNPSGDGEMEASIKAQVQLVF